VPHAAGGVVGTECPFDGRGSQRVCGPGVVLAVRATMLCPDVTVLLYAYRRDSDRHPEYAAPLRQAKAHLHDVARSHDASYNHRTACPTPGTTPARNPLWLYPVPRDLTHGGAVPRG
jgi:hypothetical protein